MLARMLVNKILMDNGQLDRQLRQRDRVYKHNVLKDSYSMLSFPTSCFPGYPAPGGYVQGGVGQEVLVVGLERVEVVVVGVAPGARPPAEPHLGHLGRHHRQVSLQVPAQQRHVSHCHTVTLTVTCHTCPAAHLSSRCGMTTPLLTTCITSCRIPEKNLACQNVKNRYSL